MHCAADLCDCAFLPLSFQPFWRCWPWFLAPDMCFCLAIYLTIWALMPHYPLLPPGVPGLYVSSGCQLSWRMAAREGDGTGKALEQQKLFERWKWWCIRMAAEEGEGGMIVWLQLENNSNIISLIFYGTTKKKRLDLFKTPLARGHESDSFDLPCSTWIKTNSVMCIRSSHEEILESMRKLLKILVKVLKKIQTGLYLAGYCP